MDAPRSVSKQLERAKAGHNSAFDYLHKRYEQEFREFVLARLDQRNRGAWNEEDIVQEAFVAFYKKMKNGDYPDLCDRVAFRALLMKFLYRRTLKQLRDDNRKKRDARRVVQNSPFPDHAIQSYRGAKPSQENEVASRDEFEQIMNCLDEEIMREILRLKRDGFTHKEIAESLGVSKSTIERLVRSIRESRKD